jgi:hypothetical protein
MRLIDADALRADAITRSGGTEFAFDNCYPFWQFSQAIAQAPTIEATPVVHGQWIEDHARCCRRCSVCGFEVHDDAAHIMFGDRHIAPKHCNCGARMDGDGNA